MQLFLSQPVLQLPSAKVHQERQRAPFPSVGSKESSAGRGTMAESVQGLSSLFL